MQMLGEGSKSILNEPEHILSFVKHALEMGAAASTPSSLHKKNETQKTRGLSVNDLRIVDEEEDKATDRDSDDEVPGLEGGRSDDEMTATALNLLLSVLEGTLTFYSTTLYN